MSKIGNNSHLFPFEIMQESASWRSGPPADFEKLWRGLALVGAAHLAGMTVNILAQIAGIQALDKIPAMFLGL